MKNLFVYFIADDDLEHHNIVIEAEKITNSDDIDTLTKYIELKTGYQEVVISNFRRME